MTASIPTLIEFAVLVLLVTWTWRRNGAPWQKSAPKAIPAPAGDVAARARDLVQMQELLTDGVSGEYKRHRVYAQLIDDFPTMPKRALARAIEDALRDLEG